MPPNTFDPESAGIPARVTVGEEHAGKDASAPRRFMDRVKSPQKPKRIQSLLTTAPTFSLGC